MSRYPADRSILDPRQRAAALADAVTDTCDVLVIGAGVTGAGVALDAAGRGLRAVLVEAGDLASGTSSRSGKMFHGGLRYLEQLNFPLVNSALHERNLMVNTLCPYLAEPEPFLFPLSRFWERPYMGAGIALYDAMTLRRRGVPHHRHFTRTGLLAEAPGLDPSAVRGGIRYYDVRIDDARHVMTLARTAAQVGAAVITRAAVVDFRHDGDRISGAVIEDRLSGRRFEVRARVVINAGGIWAAELQKLAGAQTFRMAPAKGVHLVFPRSVLDSDTGILARAEDSVIIMRKWWNYWVLGTTDTAYSGDLAAPRAEPEEVDYLLRNINRYLVRPLSRADVVGTFAGLRPLLAPVDDDPDATSALSRDHSVIAGPDGLISIVGGKYTTYRAMAEDAVDAAVDQLGGGYPPSPSETLPVVGTTGWEAARNRAATIAGRFGLRVSDVERLISRYGALTEDVLEPAEDDPALARPLPGAPAYLAAEFRYAATHEGALTLEDVLARRTHVSFETVDGGVEVAPAVAAVVAPLLGWNEVDREHQLRSYLTWIAAERAALQETVAEDAGARTAPATASA